VSGDGERRGRGKTVCARGVNLAASRGRSTWTLDANVSVATLPCLRSSGLTCSPVGGRPDLAIRRFARPRRHLLPLLLYAASSIAGGLEVGRSCSPTRNTGGVDQLASAGTPTRYSLRFCGDCGGVRRRVAFLGLASTLRSVASGANRRACRLSSGATAKWYAVDWHLTIVGAGRDAR
jgi:hypothetical protein